MTEYRMFVRRNKKHQPRGILVANRNSLGQIVIGWSYVNKKAGDRFNKLRSLCIARARIEVGTDKIIPHEVMHCVRRFRNEVLRHAYDLDRELLHVAGNTGFIELGGIPIVEDRGVVNSD